MAQTYQAFLQNEIRALQIEIDDNDGTDFQADNAYYQVQDSTGTVIVPPVTSAGLPDYPFQAALVEANAISVLIGTIVTQNVGTYKVVWKIIHTTHTYYHTTELEIQQL